MSTPDAASPGASKSELGAIERLAEPVCASHGVELVHVAMATERGGRVLRVLIDREVVGPEGEIRSGITLADCQSVSRDLSAELDAHDPIRGAYRLEISSPGLDRPLVKPRHFERFAGSEVKVELLRAMSVPASGADPEGGKSQRRRFRGRLLGVDKEGPEGPLPEDQVRIKIEVEGETFAFSITEIAKANVVHRHE